MTYDLNSELDRQRFRTRCEHLLEHRSKVDLTKHSPKRTLSQNALLHVWIACIAQELGYTSREDCKRDVKRQILGMRPYENKITGKTYYTDYSTSEMTVEGLADFMNAIKVWALSELGIYLPYDHEEGYTEMVTRYR